MKIGDRYYFYSDEFDGCTRIEAIVTEISEDHAILTTADGIKLWYDDDTADLFIYIDSARERKFDELWDKLSALVKDYTFDAYCELISCCSDWNSEHPDDEIFMCELYKEDGYDNDGIMIENDYQLYEQER